MAEEIDLRSTVLNTRQTRRTFLHRAAALGLATPAMAALLAACGGDDDDDDDTPTAAAGTTPTAVTGATPGATEPAGAATATTGGQEPAATSTTASGPEATATTAEEPSGAVGGQAVISMGEPDTLLSTAARSATAGYIFSFIANGMTRISQPDMDVAPDLAEAWEASEDGITYDFALRSGVLFQDGEAFSAEDVKFTYELGSHPEYPGPLPPGLASIAGAQEYKDAQADSISGITVVDDTNVQIVLTGPSALFLATVASEWVLPMHVLEGVSPAGVAEHEFARAPIYTGPFKVEEWRTGEGITYTAHTEHFNGRPNLDTLVARNIPDPATAIAELQAGGTQLGFVQPDQFEQFSGDDNYTTQELAGGGGWFLEFDITNPLFTDPRVRMAMSHAIDRDAIIEAIFLGKAEANYSIASPLSWIYNPDIPTFPYDVDKANALLDEAGWTMGSDGVREKDGQKLEFNMILTLTTQQWAIAIQPFLEEVGIRYEIETMEFGTWIENLVVGKYEAGFSGWFNFIIDPRADLQAHFETPRATDATGYDNPEVTALFADARAALSREAEKDIYDQIQEIAEGEAVYVYCWRPNNLLVVNKAISVPTVQIQPELYARAPEWSVSA